MEKVQGLGCREDLNQVWNGPYKGGILLKTSLTSKDKVMSEEFKTFGSRGYHDKKKLGIHLNF